MSDTGARPPPTSIDLITMRSMEPTDATQLNIVTAPRPHQLAISPLLAEINLEPHQEITFVATLHILSNYLTRIEVVD